MVSNQSSTTNEAPQQKTKPRNKRYPTMHKLIDMQRALEKEVMNDDTFQNDKGTFAVVSSRDKAACARAWKELETLRRVILGKPITVEAARLKLPKARKLGTITPMPDTGDTAQASS